MKRPIIITLILLLGCAASVPIPKWYLNPPSKIGYRYAQGTERGDEIQNAVDEATNLAVAELARTTETELSGNINRVQDEVNDRTIVDKFTSAQNGVYSVALKDWRVAKKEIVEDGGLYRAYVLVEWDEGAAQKRLMDQIKADQDLYEAMRPTELMEEMEQKVEEYRKRRGN